MMGAIPRLSDGKINLQQPTTEDEEEEEEEDVVEEIERLIKVYKDGRVERLPAVADVPCTWSPKPDIACCDAVVAGDLPARLYLPKHQAPPLHLPLLVYFHGGGFCVGSVAWRCYHEFLSRLASQAGCAVLSASYRLAPEHRLPAAYEDGLAAVRWVQQRAAAAEDDDDDDELSWWSSRCDFARMFLAGDSAGANIAYHVAASGHGLGLKGLILIQPFFGGAARTWSEKNLPQPSRSALSLATSDCYWRMALPPGADRDHPWCNPSPKGELEELRLPPVLVCVAELDILRDRNVELCHAMRRAGKRVEQATFAGVGHAFQVLHNYHMSHARTSEMLSLIKDFTDNNR